MPEFKVKMTVELLVSFDDEKPTEEAVRIAAADRWTYDGREVPIWSKRWGKVVVVQTGGKIDTVEPRGGASPHRPSVQRPARQDGADKARGALPPVPRDGGAGGDLWDIY